MSAELPKRRVNWLTVVLVAIIVVLSIALIALENDSVTVERRARELFCSTEAQEGSDLWQACVDNSY